MKLIKVTSALAHNKGKEIYINTERILSITDANLYSRRKSTQYYK